MEQSIQDKCETGLLGHNKAFHTFDDPHNIEVDVVQLAADLGGHKQHVLDDH